MLGCLEVLVGESWPCPICVLWDPEPPTPWAVWAAGEGEILGNSATLPLSAETPPAELTQIWGPSTGGDGPDMAAKIIRRMESLRELGFLGLEKRRLKGDTTVPIQCLRELTRKVKTEYFQGQIVIGQSGMASD